MRNKNGLQHLRRCISPVGKGNSYCKHTTHISRVSSIVAAAVTIAVFSLFLSAMPAAAVGEGEPEEVFFGMVSSCDSGTIAVPSPNPWRPAVDQDEVEILARLLWSSPLTNETDKRKLCWIVFNRVDDESLLFGGCISDVVIKREFTFFDARAYLSETNLRIAADELSRWKAELMGIPVERPLEAGYLYLRFSGHSVEFLKAR